MALRNPKQQQARALKMVESKIMQGKTNAEIAKDFGLSTTSVAKAMSLAAKADLIVAFEDKLVNELLPLAHQAAMSALLDGNARVAMEVLKGAQILRPQQARTAAQTHDDDELTKYIAQKRLQARQEELTVDADFTARDQESLSSRPQQALPPSSALDDAESDVRGAGDRPPTPPTAPTLGPDGDVAAATRVRLGLNPKDFSDV